MMSLPSICPSLHPSVCPPLYVSQYEIRHSTLPFAATCIFFGGKLHGQLLFRKTNGNFEESYKFMYSLNMSTNEKRRERERKKMKTLAMNKLNSTEFKRQRLTNASWNNRVFCHFNRISAPCGSGDSKYFSCFFFSLSLCL